MRTPSIAAAALATAAVLSSPSAEANSRYPASSQIVFSTDASVVPNVVAVRTTFGILVSRDDGETWRWICEDALGVPPASIEDPSIAVTAGDALVVGLDEGLDVSPDLGCNFGCVAGPLAGRPIVDLVVRPNAPHTVLALASSYVFGDSGTSAAMQDIRIYQSTDDGAHWSLLGTPIDPSVNVTTLDVAKSDPSRLYVSATRGFGAQRTASLFVSTDSAQTWTERSMPFDSATEVAVYIGAVDPSFADRVYVRSSGASRLFVTSDAGESFQVALTLTGEMLGFAIAADGSKVYAGSVEDGLFVERELANADVAAARSLDGGPAFTRMSSIHVQCLAMRGSELWACSDEASGFEVGVSTNDGSTFEPRLRLGGLTGAVTCAANTAGPYACDTDANASQCAGSPFETLCGTLDGCSDLDGGTAQGGAAEGGTVDARTAGANRPIGGRGCATSCGVAPSRGGAAAVLATGCAIAATIGRKRRTKRRSLRPDG